MKKKGISIAAVFIACVFVVTIGAFVYCIYSDFKVGTASAKERFEKLSSHVAETSGTFPCGSKEFLDAFNFAILTPNVYESIKLKVDDIEVYTYPSVPQNSNSAFVKTFSTRIVGGDGAKIELSANIYALSPAIIFSRTKITFIIILAGTLASCILLMYVYLSNTEREMQTRMVEAHEPQVVNFTNQNRDEPAADYDDFEMENPDLAETENLVEESVPKEFEREKVQDAKNDRDEDFLENEDDENEDDENERPASEAEPSFAASGAVVKDPMPLEIDTDSKGLFSPASGFGWENYLETRLESELARAASSEQDLALAMIKIPKVNSSANCYSKICEKLLGCFQYKDFIFEYEDDGFSAIMQGSNIDEALKIAEELYTDLVSILSSHKTQSKPYIGISSRSLRLVSAERLRTEAEQALLHAADDKESPIVAFRVNPEKYRQYISQKNS